MKIAKFNHQEFGGLTTITNEKSGNTMFMAAEVGKMWGHTNMKQTVGRLLNKEETLVIKKSEYGSFFKLLVSNKVLPTKAQRIQLITESGLYKLVMASNLEKANPFKDWVTGEVLPSIRKTGGYSIASWTSQQINKHTDVSQQKINSKNINSLNFEKGGIEKVIEYNRESCLLHTGLTPSEIKEIARQKGLKAKDRTSGKEALRHLKPAVACGMSFTDTLVKQGFDLKTVSELSKKAAIPLFEGMLELGIKPQELLS